MRRKLLAAKEWLGDISLLQWIVTGTWSLFVGGGAGVYLKMAASLPWPAVIMLGTAVALVVSIVTMIAIKKIFGPEPDAGGVSTAEPRTALPDAPPSALYIGPGAENIFFGHSRVRGYERGVTAYGKGVQIEGIDFHGPESSLPASDHSIPTSDYRALRNCIYYSRFGHWTLTHQELMSEDVIRVLEDGAREFEQLASDGHLVIRGDPNKTSGPHVDIAPEVWLEQQIDRLSLHTAKAKTQHRLNGNHVTPIYYKLVASQAEVERLFGHKFRDKDDEEQD